MVIQFRRNVETPFTPDGTTIVEVYDPTYFTAYSLTDPPRLEGAPESCHAEVIPFRPTGVLASLQQQLLEIPIDADPDGEPGALLADRVRVTCD